jgi:CheY-like chemotaxis protein
VTILPTDFETLVDAEKRPGSRGSRLPRSHLPEPEFPNKFTLLLAEDNCNDRELLERFLGSAGLASVHSVSCGDDVIAYLAGRGEYADRGKHPYPHVLLLDLAMPKGHGLEVLEWLADHAELPLCSVYILTGSRDPDLRRRAISYGVAGFFQKPLSLAQVAWIVEDRMALMY